MKKIDVHMFSSFSDFLDFLACPCKYKETLLQKICVGFLAKSKKSTERTEQLNKNRDVIFLKGCEKEVEMMVSGFGLFTPVHQSR